MVPVMSVVSGCPALNLFLWLSEARKNALSLMISIVYLKTIGSQNVRAAQAQRESGVDFCPGNPNH